MRKRPAFLQLKIDKNWLIPIVVLFLGFVLFGLWAASRLHSPLTKDVHTETQKNYLFVQVDNLEEKSPEVISIWVAFVNRSAYTHIVFMPLYPNSDVKINNKLHKALRVNRDGLVADRSVRKLERKYHIRTNGFVVVDNTALTSIASQLLKESLTSADLAPDPHDAEGISRFLASAEDHFSSFCAQIQQQDSELTLDRFDWNQILPAHFRTDLSFEELTIEFESILKAGQIQTCEVIENG